MPPDAPPPAARPPSRAGRARVLAGLLFLALAAGWAGVALRWWGPGRSGDGAPTTVQVRVLDAAGQALREVEVRSRYGGAWQRPAADGRVDLALLPLGPEAAGGPGEAGDPLAARLADALEVRAAYAAARRGRQAEVLHAEGRLSATFHVEPCGLLTLLVPQTGFREVRATLDPDPGTERWRLLEGREVVRGGEAATWAVFGEAVDVGLTLEGDQGVARQRVVVRAPGPGHRVEHTLFPRPAAPISGRVRAADDSAPPSLAGVLDVRELPPTGPPVEHPSVRIAPDGAFEVQYAGAARYELTPRVGFLAPGGRREAEGGDRDLELPLAPRPWLELERSLLPPGGPLPRVLLRREGADDDVLPAFGVLLTAQRLAVAAPAAGAYRLLLSTAGDDEAPPRSGEARVEVPAAGPVPVTLSLAPLPHGTVEVRIAAVPPRGGDVTLLPERTRTWLQGFEGRAAFPHVPTGRAYALVRWRDPALAADLLTGEVAAGATLALTARAEPGGWVRVDLAGTPAERSAAPWALRLAAGATPYGDAEGTLPLVREGAGTRATGLFALRAGAYRAHLHARTPDGPPPLPLAFTVQAGATTLVRAAGP